MRWTITASLLLCCSSPERGTIAASGDAGVMPMDPSMPSDPGTPDPTGPDPSAMSGCDKMDILFIIDDSESMTEEQSNLINNFPRFVEVVDAFRTDDGRPLDYRIGVTTTGRPLTVHVNIPPLVNMTRMDDGPDGALLRDSGCGMSRAWIESGDSSPAETFSCIANVGTMGSGTEMPLQMLEHALVDRVSDGQNTGFLRDDALLAVVVLTDEDDCSQMGDEVRVEGDIFNLSVGCEPDNPELVPLAHFLDVYDNVKGDRGRWAMAAIAGTGPGACMSRFGDAWEAARLISFADMAGDNVTVSSICDGDLSGALMDALNTFDSACQAFPPLI